jgi:hypothetical protein
MPVSWLMHPSTILYGHIGIAQQTYGKVLSLELDRINYIPKIVMRVEAFGYFVAGELEPKCFQNNVLTISN